MLKKRNLIFRCLLILGVFLLTGCFLVSNTSYTVTYDGNGNTDGSVPIDNRVYQGNQLVTILSEGDLVKTQDGISLLFTGWNTAIDGSGTNQAEESTFTMGSTDVILFAQWSVIRGTGPAGGLIFYDAGAYYDTPSWRYLEVAPSDQSTGALWGCYGTSTGATDTMMGAGWQNTIDIENVCKNPGTPADICANLSLGGYEDWFLPSKDELNEMYKNLYNINNPVGGFDPDAYWWSSSEMNPSNAWGQGFGWDEQLESNKDNNFRVRAVRAF